MYRIAWLPLIACAVGGAFVVTALLHPLTGEPTASIVGLGLGLTLAVYLDRRWIRPRAEPLREAVSMGAATALGWALAQGIVGML
ncbi:MAG TPA: hypothetical protein VGR37_01935 [Longimicrobiaceae bacterium]|nr:hypothetical protein [Longimicrobiaceae bacterium]